MKPQSLQDAIKANALLREKARQSSGWKEPVVKQHKVSAEDMVKSPNRRVQSPIAAPPIHAAMIPNAANNAEITYIKRNVDKIQQELKQHKEDIVALKKENKELRDAIAALMSDKENKVKTPASLEPHSVNDLAHSQREDKVLRKYMRTKEGLYDGKYMSIRDENGSSIICFKKKIYIPENLRAKTIKHYKRCHTTTDSDALAALRKNCCWPDLEKDFYDPAKY
jgi:regulator of replication initiation timing